MALCIPIFSRTGRKPNSFTRSLDSFFTSEPSKSKKTLFPVGIRTDTHNDVIKWKLFPRYWPFVGGIHRSSVNSPHKVQWRGALMFSLICARINGWVNTRKAGDLRRHRPHYDVIVIQIYKYRYRCNDLPKIRVATNVITNVSLAIPLLYPMAEIKWDLTYFKQAT